MCAHGGFRRLLPRWLTIALTTLIPLAVGFPVASGDPTHANGQRWVAAWGDEPVVGIEIPFSPDCPAGAGLRDQTVRNVVFVSTGGPAVRVRLTNASGIQPLRTGHASVAVQGSAANAVTGTLRELTFCGPRNTTIPAGRELYSDPVRLRVAPLSTLLVSVYLPEATGPLTNHPFTAQGNYLADGDRALAGDGTGYAPTPCWMVADGADIRAPERILGSVVALGDSITDTANTTGNANHRWPDFLARRLNARHGPTMSVVNAGLGGNRLLAPRVGEPYFGVPALDRVDRDMLAQSGVRVVVLLEGVNDIGFDATSEQLIAGYQEIIVRTHAARLPIIGGTVMPFKGSFVWTTQRELTWATVNTWIRTTAPFDYVIDFAAATAASTDPVTLNPTYDSGDHLHPNDAGTQAMADAGNLTPAA